MYKIETNCVRGVYKPMSGDPAILPINQSTTYNYESGDDLADLFALKKEGHIYSRISNPTVSAVEGKVALLEGGVGCLAASTGHAGILNTFLNLCKSGDHIVSSSNIYGGIYNLLVNTLPKYGITTTFINQDDDQDTILQSFQDNTKLLFCEILSNPTVKLLDVKKFVSIAKKATVPFVLDNTLLSPALFRPIDFGVDIVVHSGSKYMDGHGTSLAGFVVDSGKFDYSCGKYDDFVTPDKSYNGLVYTDLKENAFLTKARIQFTRDFGNYLSPFNAFLINMNLETLHIRMDRHSENALALAKFLETNHNVEKVNYSMLDSSPDKNLAKDLGLKGAGGILSFYIKGDKQRAKDFTASLKLTSLMTHLGDLRTSVIHPATTTHSQLNDEQLKSAGVEYNLIRVSVGLENIDDIIEDFKNALNEC